MCPYSNKFWNKWWNKRWMPPTNNKKRTKTMSQYLPGLPMLLPSWTLPIPLTSTLWSWVKECIHDKHKTTYWTMSLKSHTQNHVNLSPFHRLLQLLPCDDLHGRPTQMSSRPTQTLSRPLLGSCTYILSLSKEGYIIENLYHKKP